MPYGRSCGWAEAVQHLHVHATVRHLRILSETVINEGEGMTEKGRRAYSAINPLDGYGGKDPSHTKHGTNFLSVSGCLPDRTFPRKTYPHRTFPRNDTIG